MASNARRAVRFFGTVHDQVNAIRSQPTRIRQHFFTRERFPAFLAASCATGLIIGWQIMDRIHFAAAQEHVEKFERDNFDYQAARRKPSVQRRYTIASVKPVNDPRSPSLWSSVE